MVKQRILILERKTKNKKGKTEMMKVWRRTFKNASFSVSQGYHRPRHYIATQGNYTDVMSV